LFCRTVAAGRTLAHVPGAEVVGPKDELVRLGQAIAPGVSGDVNDGVATCPPHCFSEIMAEPWAILFPDIVARSGSRICRNSTSWRMISSRRESDELSHVPVSAQI